MASKTLNLKSSGCSLSNSNIDSYSDNAFTTSKISGGGTANLKWILDLKTIFGTTDVVINSIKLNYKAVSNRSLSTYKQCTVRTGYLTSGLGTSQVYEYKESTAREGKTPTPYSDSFSSSHCNNKFTHNGNTVTGLYISTYNPGSFNIIIYYTEVSLTVDYSIPVTPPQFTSAEMKYLDKQISNTNKVIAGESFVISVGVT